jgi:PAS domain S-box-containing protein
MSSFKKSIHLKDYDVYLKNIKVLYIWDNKQINDKHMDNDSLKIFKELFPNLITAKNLGKGFELFLNSEPHIIIIDIDKCCDGLKLANAIKRKNQNIPIIIYSKYKKKDIFLESIKVPVDGYLLKPLSVETLYYLLRKIIDKITYAESIKNNIRFLNAFVKATNHSSIISKTDPQGIITYVNDAFCKISGYSKDELIGSSHNIIRHPNNPKEMYKQMWQVIKHEKGIWKGVIRNMTKYGKSYYVDCLVMPIINESGKIIEYISLRNDITDIMSPTKQLNDAIKNAKEPIVVFIKIEDFDIMEDFYDNNTIFMIQEEAKKSFERELGKEFNFDKLYHLENGEYAFILEKDVCKKNSAQVIIHLKQIQNSINKTYLKVDGHYHLISTLFSVAFSGKKKFESAKLGIKKLIKDRNSFIVADGLASIEQKRAKENMKIVHTIKNALSNSRIVLYFQPIIDNKTGKITKYESLVRLIDEKDRVLPPRIFLETAKKSNLYSQITNEVLKYSFKMLRKFNIDISINLSAIDIEQNSTREIIIKLLESHKEFGRNIVFELLEDEKIRNFKVVKEFIKLVKGYGVKIAIDDFGAGHSNYKRLLNYEPDILKIDGSLIRDINNSNCYCISAVKSIVTFAKEQNLKTVAEYIESEEIFNIIKELGIDYSQGYYLGKPQPFEGYDKSL